MNSQKVYTKIGKDNNQSDDIFKMSTKVTTIILLVLVLSTWVIGITSYFYLPETATIIQHNALSEISLHKERIAFGNPLMITMFLLLYFYLPHIKSLSNYIDKFRKHYNIFATFLVVSIFLIFISVYINIFIRPIITYKMFPIIISLCIYLYANFIRDGGLNFIILSSCDPFEIDSDYMNRRNIFKGKVFKIAAFFTFLTVFFNLPILNFFLFLPFLSGTILIALYGIYTSGRF